LYRPAPIFPGKSVTSTPASANLMVVNVDQSAAVVYRENAMRDMKAFSENEETIGSVQRIWQNFEGMHRRRNCHILLPGHTEITQIVVYVAILLLVSNVAAAGEPPDNAALLYYQIFLEYEEPNQPIRWALSDFCKGLIGCNEAITQHIKENHHVIDRVVKAADIPKCDWGYDCSEAIFDINAPSLPPLNRITLLLAADARWLAEQGKYTEALDRSVALRKIALHAGYRTLNFYLLGNQTNRIANETAQYVLGFTPSGVDESTLTRFKSRLTQTEATFPSLASALTQEAHMWIAMMQRDKIQLLVNVFPEGSLAGIALKPMLARIPRNDDVFLQRSRAYYLNALDMVVSILESRLSYPQKCAKLDDLVEQWGREAENNVDAILTELFFPMRTELYRSVIRQQTQLNALKTAIDLYSIKARTGQLPDTLPLDSPTDLFSGKPFAYAKTAEGFILRCQGKEDPKKDTVHEYKFKVK